MDRWVCSFMTGMISSLLWPALPTAAVLLALIVILVWQSTAKHPLAHVISGAASGALWIASVGYWQLHWQYPNVDWSEPVIATGTVDSIVLRGQNSAQRVKFNLALETVNGSTLWPFQPKVRLSWRDPKFAIGQGVQVRLMTRLKPSRGLANEGAFNYQQWLFTQGIIATGYVADNANNSLLSAQTSVRQTLLNRLSLTPLKQRRWIQALALGYRGDFVTADWVLLQRTGTAHLMAISGMHLGLVAAMAFLVLRQLLVMLSPILPTSAQHNYQTPLMCLTCLLTLLYAQITGFAIPVFRAWIMALLGCLILVSARHLSPSRFLLYSLWVICLCMPLSIFTLSFWMSAAAVAVLVFSYWRWPGNRLGDWRSAAHLVIRVQVVLVVLMAPVTAIFFDNLSWLAVPVNLVAVPLVSFVLLPLHLLGLVLLLFQWDAGFGVFVLLDRLLDAGIGGLTWLSGQDFTATAVGSLSPLPLVFIAVGVVLAMLPRFSGKWLLVIACTLPLLSDLWRHPPKATSQWFLHVFDVGQGLSVAIEKDRHWLLYDVGAAYPDGFNSFEASVRPAMFRRGINAIDWLLISHYDNDHSGSLSQVFSGAQVNAFASSNDICVNGWSLSWRGLSVRALWPDKRYAIDSDNNLSCVIAVTDGQHRVLLSGDIEKKVERLLVAQQRQQIAADVLVVPHHGSKTSSSKAFIHAVSPAFAVVSRGYRNRWGFPHPTVVQRFRESGAQWLDTSDTGQVSFTFDDTGIGVRRYRQNDYPYWYANANRENK